MKARYVIAFLLTVAICLSGCSNGAGTDTGNGTDSPATDSQTADIQTAESRETDSTEAPVLPPSRTGTVSDAVEIRLARRFTLEEALESADAAAVIEIGNWISESKEHMCTYYEASAVTVYKGELPSEFVFGQFGYSEYTAEKYPLCTYGQKLFVFLLENQYDGFEIRDFWYSLGEYSTVAYIAEDPGGTEYVMDLTGDLTPDMPGVKNYVGDPFVYRQLKEYDPVLTGCVAGFNSVIALEDLENGIRAILEDSGN